MAKLSFKSKSKEKTVSLGNYTLTAKNHDALLKHCLVRLRAATATRDLFVEKISVIDREIAGYIELDQDDKKRERDNQRGKGPKTTDINIQLVLTQLDEAVTYLLSVLAPDEGMYGAIAEKEKQDIANGFATLMNDQGVAFQHYRNYGKAFLDMLKYNFGGNLVEWQEVKGNRLQNNPDNPTVVEIVNDVVLSGNAIDAIDPYNVLWDVSVDNPVDIPTKGEFIAFVKVYTDFRMRKREADGDIFGVDRFINEQHTYEFYKQKPIVHEGKTGDTGTNWVSVLSMGETRELQPHHEEVDVYIWIRPSDFGLTKDKDLQIWRITLVNQKYIVAVEHMSNAHGMLPAAISMPFEDGMNFQTRSAAEILLPLQRFASHQFNIKQRADRKALYGTTIYDQQVIPLLETADLEGGKIPAKPTGQDRDLRRSILHYSDVPNTTGTMNDVAATNDLMQKMLPTDTARQVASLERATQYQAAATVQGSNRRNHKLAKIIYDQALSRVRFMMMYNIFQFQQSMEVLDNETGEVIQIDPSKFREARIEFTISDGLKGIDKLHVVESLRDVINMMLQSQVASEQVDIVDIIDYWLNLAGDKTDFKQFKYKSEMDKQPPQVRDMAWQLLQQLQAQQQEQQAGGGNVAQLPGAE